LRKGSQPDIEKSELEMNGQKSRYNFYLTKNLYMVTSLICQHISKYIYINMFEGEKLIVSNDMFNFDKWQR
jgi:hypothetical protein